jgi:hypothetical protein
LNYKTEEKNENIYLPDKKGKMRKVHAVLTYQMQNNRLGCINRDKNSVYNMKKLTLYYLENKSRPEKYKRGLELEKKQKTPTKESNVRHAPNSNTKTKNIKMKRVSAIIPLFSEKI